MKAKRFFVLFFAAAAVSAAAQEGGGAARPGALARMGGLVEQPAEGPACLFLNMQGRVPAEALADTPAQVSRMLRIAATLETLEGAPADPLAAVRERLEGGGVAAIVGVCDAPGLPTLLIAPESRWALVNVAALAADAPSAETLAARVRKGQWRAFAHLMGAAESAFEHCLMKPVHSLADLDALTAPSVCPEPFGRIIANAGRLGARPIRAVPYRRACEEGWAPAPTNDVQKAIWDEVRARAAD